MREKEKVLMLASVASMIDQFNMPNISLMQRMGYEVHVACNFKEGNTCDRRRIKSLQGQLERMHVAWHPWDCPRSMDAIGKCCMAYRQLLELTGRHRYAWMHCHSPIGGALARLVAHRRDIRVVYTAHGFHFYRGAPLKNWLVYYPVEKLLSYWTDVLVTVNREDYRFAKQRLKAGKVAYIPGVGIHTERFQKQEGISHEEFLKQYRIPQGAQVLLSVGELSRRKNHKAAIAALAELERDDVYYMICGQGRLGKQLMRYAGKLGVAGHIRMPGFLEDVSVLYRNADIFLFPSVQEGLPVALMEAMASGLPCVASDIRGNRDLVDAGCGGLFPLKDRGQMLEGIKRLLDDPRLRVACGSRSQEKIKAYDLSIVESRMEQIYRSLGQGKSREQGKSCQKQPEISCSLGQHKSRQKQPEISCSLGQHKSCQKQPEISVIMAVYNAAGGQMLREAIASIQNQTYEDWELVVCDDGSTDHTWEVLEGIAKKDLRIRLVHGTCNRKAGYARNLCIQAARGRYIAVMDADDVSAPGRLEKQRQYLETHAEVAFAGCRGEFFIQNIGDDKERYWYRSRPEARDFLFSLPYVHASLMFRREALELVHGYDSSRLAVRVEDYDLLLRLYGMGQRGANLPEVLYYIRRDAQQYRRRKYRYRLHEAYVKYKGFLGLGLMPVGIPYACKPLLVGMLPIGLLKALQKKYYRDRQ